MTDVPLDQSSGMIDLSTPPRLIMFVHVPKTAGTAVTSILSVNQVGRPSLSGVGRPSLNQIGRPSLYQTARPRNPKTWHLINGGMVWNVFKGAGGLDLSLYERLQDPEQTTIRRYLEALGPADAALVRGHFPLGVRERMPPLLRKGREIRYLTFLRDPVDRMLSHFFTVVNQHAGSPNPNWRGKKLDLSPLPIEPTLEDAIAGGYLHENLHTRMLSGIPEPFGEVTEETLERAKENLHDPRLVFGLAERFDESLVLIKRRFGLRCILTHTPDRINRGRPRGREVPAELVAAAKEANRYDIELYRYASELFDAEADLSEPDFETELLALRAARGSGPIQVDQPPPDGFEGSTAVWQERVAGLAQAQRFAWEVGELRVNLYEAMAEKDKLEQDLEASQARSSKQIARLQQQLGSAGIEMRGKANRERTKAKRERASGSGKSGGKLKRRRRLG